MHHITVFFFALLFLSVLKSISYKTIDFLGMYPCLFSFGQILTYYSLCASELE